VVGAVVEVEIEASPVNEVITSSVTVILMDFRIQICVIGPPRVIVLSDPLSPSAQLSRPKAVAFLAYLAIEGRHVARTDLLHVLWPDKTERAARAALSQTIHTIRRFTAPLEPFLISGDLVGLDAITVRADITELRNQVSCITPEELLQYIGQDLMQGFLLSEPDTYTDWLEARRREFSTEMMDLGWRAAQRASSALKALAILEHLARIRPYDEVLLRRRLELLTQSSDLGSALNLYETFRLKLADEFGNRPSPETVRLVARICAEAETSPVSQQRGSTVNALAKQPEEQGTPPGGSPEVGGGGSRLLRPIVAVAGTALLLLVGMWMATMGEAEEQLRPDVSISELKLATPDELQEQAILRLAALLNQQSDFGVRVATRANYRLKGSVRLDSAGVRGHISLMSPDEKLLADMPLNFGTSTESEAFEELAAVVRASVRIALATTDEQVALAKFDRLVDQSGTHVRRGAYDVALVALGAADSLVRESGALYGRSHDLTALLAEKRGMTLAYKNDWGGAFSVFRQAALSIDGEVDNDPALRYRAGSLHYLAWVADPNSSVEYLQAAERHLRAAAVQGAVQQAWVRLASVYMGLGKFADAYSAAEAASRMAGLPDLRTEQAMVKFQAAFAGYLDKEAVRACNDLRERTQQQFTAFYCGAILESIGLEGPGLDELIDEFTNMHSADRQRAGTQQLGACLLALVATAKARVPLAEALLVTCGESQQDVDHALFRGAAVAKMKGSAAAEPYVTELRSSPAGRRALRLYRRLFDPVSADLLQGPD
jgi:DNA-binding SARP family transcriptional activator